MRFTLGTPAAPPPAASPGYPPPGYPPGYPSAPLLNSTEAAFGTMTPETAKPDGEDGPRLPVRESKLQTFLLFAVVALALTAAGIAVWYKLTHKPDAPNQETVTRFKDVNLGFEPPPSPWVQDAETKKTLDAPFMLVYKRDNPEAYMAFGARDYKTREPRGSELREVLLAALDKIIDSSSRKEYPEEVEKVWLGQDVRGFKFSGLQKGGGNIEGEAIAVSNKGIAYWFVSWTSNEMYPEQKSAFADGRTGCKLLELRRDWKPKQSNIADYKNTDIGYIISDPDGDWKEITDEETLKYEGADKMLTLKLGKGRNHRPEGTLAVFIRPPGADPLAEARTFVTERRTNQLQSANPEISVTFQDRSDTPAEQPANPIKQSSEVFRLRSTVKNALNQDRLHVISAAKIGEKIVVAHAWCDWADRDAFEAIFVQVVGSLRADK
jgi:hypothetical protein